MSTLETLVLPGIIGKNFKATFVIKNSLLKYPFFGRILTAINAIPVTRKNPKEDYRIVIQEGLKRLEQGISVIVFPQAARQTVFDPAQFNTLGVKLAKKASVPAVPIALRTDAWGTGTYKRLWKNRPLQTNLFLLDLLFILTIKAWRNIFKLFVS